MASSKLSSIMVSHPTVEAQGPPIVNASNLVEGPSYDFPNKNCIPSYFLKHLPMQQALGTAEGQKEIQQVNNQSYERIQKIQVKKQQENTLSEVVHHKCE